MVMMSWFYELLANLLAWYKVDWRWLAFWWFSFCNLGLVVKLSSLFVLLGPRYCCFGKCIWSLAVLLNICFPLSSYFKASNCCRVDLLPSFRKLLVNVLLFIFEEAELFLRAVDCCAWCNYCKLYPDGSFLLGWFKFFLWSMQDIEWCWRSVLFYSCTEYSWWLAPRSI